MKKILVLIAALFIGLNAHAQLVAKAGYLNATDRSKVTNLDPSSINLNGLYAGADYWIALPFLDGLYATPGAYMNFLFGKNDDLHYTDIALNIPVYATYTYEIIDDFKVMGSTGPVVNFGLLKNNWFKFNGQTKIDDYYDNGRAATYNRFMLMWGVGLGIEVANMIQVTSGFEFGLTPFYSDDYVRATRPYQIKIGIGYIF